MSDIFISYKREEKSVARKLVDTLERNGWSVWWDPNIRTGEHFDDVIENALKDAKCVIVLWSQRSVKSRYIKAEAGTALKLNKLLPVAIEKVDLPFRFAGLHTAQLCDWDGTESHPGLQKLIADIMPLIDGSPKKLKHINSTQPKITIDASRNQDKSQSNTHSSSMPLPNIEFIPVTSQINLEHLKLEDPELVPVVSEYLSAVDEFNKFQKKGRIEIRNLQNSGASLEFFGPMIMVKISEIYEERLKLKMKELGLSEAFCRSHLDARTFNLPTLSDAMSGVQKAQNTCKKYLDDVESWLESIGNKNSPKDPLKKLK